jgi:hypothetical protein
MKIPMRGKEKEPNDEMDSSNKRKRNTGQKSKIKKECENHKKNLNKQSRGWWQWALLLMKSASSGPHPLTPQHR